MSSRVLIGLTVVIVIATSVSLIASPTAGQMVAQDTECKLGSDIWVDACPSLTVTAQWDEDAENDCTYNPPPGYVILESSVAVHSSSSGSHSVNTIAGGSRFATEGNFESARQAILDGTVAYRDGKGENLYRGRRLMPQIPVGSTFRR